MLLCIVHVIRSYFVLYTSTERIGHVKRGYFALYTSTECYFVLYTSTEITLHCTRQQRLLCIVHVNRGYFVLYTSTECYFALYTLTEFALCTSVEVALFCTRQQNVHHHHHQSLNREGRLGTTNDFATSCLHFSLFSTALWDLPNSRPVHSLMLSSHLFHCPPCLLPPFTVPCKMVLARHDERET